MKQLLTIQAMTYTWKELEEDSKKGMTFPEYIINPESNTVEYTLDYKVKFVHGRQYYLFDIITAQGGLQLELEALGVIEFFETWFTDTETNLESVFESLPNVYQTDSETIPYMDYLIFDLVYETSLTLEGSETEAIVEFVGYLNSDLKKVSWDNLHAITEEG